MHASLAQERALTNVHSKVLVTIENSPPPHFNRLFVCESVDLGAKECFYVMPIAPFHVHEV